MFESIAYAADAATGTPQVNPLVQFMPIILMFVIFYFLLIRPQQKKAKEHKALLDTLKKGDKVVTAGGMHGKVTSLDDKIVTLEIANGVNVKFNKGFIANVEREG